MPQIIQAYTAEHFDAAREIFIEYEKWLGVSLCFQGFQEELARLPGRYEPPGGSLLLGFIDGELGGCVASRSLDDEICEMKRLYVREAHRGSGLGRMLIGHVVAGARAAGYKRMRLDSWVPRIQKAIGMYRQLGFYEIQPYNENPYEMIFMELDLTQSSSSAGPNR